MRSRETTSVGQWRASCNTGNFRAPQGRGSSQSGVTILSWSRLPSFLGFVPYGDSYFEGDGVGYSKNHSFPFVWYQILVVFPKYQNSVRFLSRFSIRCGQVHCYRKPPSLSINLDSKSGIKRLPNVTLDPGLGGDGGGKKTGDRETDTAAVGGGGGATAQGNAPGTSQQGAEPGRMIISVTAGRLQRFARSLRDPDRQLIPEDEVFRYYLLDGGN